MPGDSVVLECACPAKINLTLAVLGRRSDGFHELHSIVARTTLVDRLSLAWDPTAPAGRDRVLVEGAGLDAEDNTVIRALRLLRDAAGVRHGAFTARLTKRIPIGSGLGGGSSDGAAALEAGARLLGTAAATLDLPALAARLGSDCPLFLEGGPVVMEGRGERVRALPQDLADRLAGLPVLLFKPWFAIETAEAYRRLAALRLYQPADTGGALLEQWRRSGRPLPPPCNDFERLLAEWLPSLAVLLHRLRNVHGLDARLSGSGSASFLVAPDLGAAKKILEEEVVRAWGRQYWIEEAVLK